MELVRVARESRRTRRATREAAVLARSATRRRWLATAAAATGMSLLAVGGAVAAGASIAAPGGPIGSWKPDLVAQTVPPIVAPGGDATVVSIETIETPLEPSAVTREDRYLPVGLSRVVSEGRPGIQLTTFSVTRVGGVEIERVPLTTVVSVEAVDGVVAVGALEVPSRPPVAPGSNRAVGKELAAARGWTGVQWDCLDNLWERESNWRHLVANPSSGAYGIPQALPGSKMASAGADWKTNPATQIRWGLGYIEGRYGTPCYAWGWWNDRYPHWY